MGSFLTNIKLKVRCSSIKSLKGLVFLTDRQKIKHFDSLLLNAVSYCPFYLLCESNFYSYLINIPYQRTNYFRLQKSAIPIDNSRDLYFSSRKIPF